MSESSPNARRAAINGALGGTLGGLLGGALGGALSRTVSDIDFPGAETALVGAFLGVAVGVPASVIAGVPIGWLFGRWRNLSAGFVATAIVAFCSVLVASFETAQKSILAGFLAYIFGMLLLSGLVLLLRPIGRGLWWARWPLLAWFCLCLIGEGYRWTHPPSFTPLSSRPAVPVVQLRAAPIPTVMGHLAIHCWFAAFDPQEGRWHRWEVWQFADSGGTSWGHLHRDLMGPDSSVGGGPGWVEREWRGDEARAILAVLTVPEEYPHLKYVAWPGPNSNTYIAWVMRRAGVPVDLDPRALGKDYLGPVGAGWTTTGTGFQVESSVMGFRAGLRDGVELHVLGFTLGIDVWTPALETPLGRLGFAE